MSAWWQYCEGKWKKINCPFPDSKETDGRKVLSEWGYSANADEIGKESGLLVCIYERHGDQPFNREWEFLVEITPAGAHVYTILIEDLPNLLHFIKEYFPAFEIDALRTHLRAVEEALDKAFMVWHGHPAWGACRHCDHEEKLRHDKRRD